MARTNLIPARLLFGAAATLTIALASITVRAQSAAPAGDGGQPGPGIQLPGTPAFSISRGVAAPDFLVGLEEDQAGQAGAAPAPQKAPARPRPPAPRNTCRRWVNADIVALAQPFMLNRLGAGMPDGLIFALRRDVNFNASGEATGLKDYKRARPIVLRANQGDCLRIKLTNLIQPYNLNSGANQIPSTTRVSLHVQGMQLVKTVSDDGSYVGRNPSSLVPLKGQATYELYAGEEGTFLLYTMGDTSTQGGQLQEGLFGSVNVQPATAEWYRSQVTEEDLEFATTGHTALKQPIIDYNALYPPNYNSTHSPDSFRQACTPILKMLDVEHEASKDQKSCLPKGTDLKLFHTDLTAIITGPRHGRFAGTTGPDNPEPPCDATAEASPRFDPLFCNNPASPDRKQPYREITTIYHEVPIDNTVQAFPVLSTSDTTVAGRDAFAINYGTGGIGAEIFANRIGVGPMGGCVDCKFEEFFLSAWTVADPAMLVDRPANAPAAPDPVFPPCTQEKLDANGPPCAGTRTPATAPYTMTPLIKATKAFYPDDPSNVYHSYLNDHVKFRILHGGTGVTHVHHQHAHQWLQSPNSDESAYLDSQMISPGASYTLEMVYNGSGNRNKTVGDSIFHCHFYPHFAAGMWAMWRVHDVFELGTKVDKDGRPDKTAGALARALPDGEIMAGTPIPALVPLPTRPMALMPSLVFIDKGQVVYGTPGSPDPTGDKVTENPGYPFFIPGVAGARAPHPPLDFAEDGKGGFLDGGLPRHVVLSGTIKEEHHDKFNWSKDFGKLNARQLPELGTNVEQVAMKYFGNRCNPSFNPDGSSINPVGHSNYPECKPLPNKAFFIVNGLPRKKPAGNSAEKLGAQQGAPFADPAVDDEGKPAGHVRTYKAAAIELDVTFNYLTSNPPGTPRQPGWHYPQERILTLWGDVQPTLNYKPNSPGGRQPEPFFFRANSKEDFIEYWHTNLVPNYYLVDDFQVRTPTDILGQHIHLVKFDVTSSDGAANGFNYEDGTFSPLEVQDALTAIAAGSWTPCAGCPPLRAPQPPPAEIIDCSANPNAPQCKPCAGQPQVVCPSWLGAQTTIQRWWADPLDNNKKVDRTMRTVFTHDHFGPSTHQQAGLYAGLLIEPDHSTWQNPETGQVFGGDGIPAPRPDGGPTSWKANILTKPPQESYREFALEFQDVALAYLYPTIPSPDPNVGYRSLGPGVTNTAIPVNPPSTPNLISTGAVPLGGTGTQDIPGTQTVSYMNEPTIWRQRGNCDFAKVFLSDCVPAPGSPAVGDPKTPLMRAYEDDKVQVRFLIGAHTLTHFFTMTGPKWPFEPSWKDSGYRSSQGNGISEHFELLFNAPPSSKLGSTRKCPDGTSQGDCVDYLYSPSNDDFGIANGMWGIFRAYDPTHPSSSLTPLPNNPLKPGSKHSYEPCPAGAKPRTFNVTAVTAQKALPNGVINFTGSASPSLTNNLGILYVFSEDLDAQGKLKASNVEPLILRAAAGECISVTLTNAMDPYSDIFKPENAVTLPAPFNAVQQGNARVEIKLSPSKNAGLSPQLVSFDAATSSGVNIGYNAADQSVPFGKSITYKWYAGNVERDAAGAIKYTPVELGSANLFPADPLLQHINGMFGALIIEPAGSSWKCDSSLDTTSIDGYVGKAPCDPSQAGYSGPPATRAAATVTEPLKRTHFREFVAMVNENLVISNSNRGAVNYQTDPTFYRYGNPSGNSPQKFASTGDNNCAISNALVSRDPLTPVFGALVGTPTRFRLLHPSDVGTAQVFTLAGHVWQREPYIHDSTQIGNNKESQWIGSHDQFGSTDHFDLTVAKAGGAFGVVGDYLYTTFLPMQNRFGSWGVFRVAKEVGGKLIVPASPPPPPCPADPAARPEPPPKNDLERFTRKPLVSKPENR